MGRSCEYEVKMNDVGMGVAFYTPCLEVFGVKRVY